jgi:competence protein ComEA
MDTGAPWRALESEGLEKAETPAGGPGRGVLLALAIAVAVLAAGSLGLAAFLEFGRGGGAVIVTGTPSSSAPGASTAAITVEVTGAVLHPGVYSMAPGSRVADAIKAAGGYSADVDPRLAETRLHLAARLTEAETIVVPRLGDSEGGTASAAVSGGLINLNTATAAQLDSLPGIGPATATKILSSRAGQPFSSVDDLVTRKLVSASTLAKFRDQVTV